MSMVITVLDEEIQYHDHRVSHYISMADLGSRYMFHMGARNALENLKVKVLEKKNDK